MTKYLFHIIGGQSMPNYIAAREINPDINVLLFTDQSVEIKNRFKNILGPSTLELKIHSYKNDEIIPRVEKFISSQLTGEIELILNFTGGTKPASISLFQYFTRRNALCIYIDSENRTRYNYFGDKYFTENITMNIPTEVFFGLEDQEIKLHNQIETKVMADLRRLLETSFKKYSKSILDDAFHRAGKKTFHGKVSKFDGKWSKVYLGKNAETQFSEIGSQLVEYLDGKWFEKSCYEKISSLHYFDNMSMNVEILFRDKKNIRAQVLSKNEIDIFASKGILPYIIECKSGQIYSSDIDQLHAIKSFSGKFSVPIILTFNQVTKPRLINRAAEKGIRLISFNDISNLPKILEGARAHL